MNGLIKYFLTMEMEFSDGDDRDSPRRKQSRKHVAEGTNPSRGMGHKKNLSNYKSEESFSI